MRPSVIGFQCAAEKLLAIELKNEDAQFSRAVDQMGTYAEYANNVYLACTPAFAAEYLERNAYSRGVNQWDSCVLERKLNSGGYGLLIVERDTVFEVLSPKEGTPLGRPGEGRATFAVKRHARRAMSRAVIVPTLPTACPSQSCVSSGRQPFSVRALCQNHLVMA